MNARIALALEYYHSPGFRYWCYRISGMPHPVLERHVWRAAYSLARHDLKEMARTVPNG